MRSGSSHHLHLEASLAVTVVQEEWVKDGSWEKCFDNVKNDNYEMLETVS